MPGMDALDRLLDRQLLPVVPNDLAPPGVDAGMFQRVEHQIERVDRVLPLGRVHPFDKAVDEGVVLEGAFRAPTAHCMRIAPLVAAVATLPPESTPITPDSTLLRRCPG